MGQHSAPEHAGMTDPDRDPGQVAGVAGGERRLTEARQDQRGVGAQCPKALDEPELATRIEWEIAARVLPQCAPHDDVVDPWQEPCRVRTVRRRQHHDFRLRQRRAERSYRRTGQDHVARVVESKHEDPPRARQDARWIGGGRQDAGRGAMRVRHGDLER